MVNNNKMTLSEATSLIPAIKLAMTGSRQASRIGALRAIPMVINTEVSFAPIFIETVEKGLASNDRDELLAAVEAVPVMAQVQPSSIPHYMDGVCHALFCDDAMTNYAARERAMRSIVTESPYMASQFAYAIDTELRRSEMSEKQWKTAREAERALLRFAPSAHSVFTDLAKKRAEKAAPAASHTSRLRAAPAHP